MICKRCGAVKTAEDSQDEHVPCNRCKVELNIEEDALMESDKLTEVERAVFECQFGFCGDFKKALWEAICRADDNNIELIALGFPVEVKGYKKFAWESGWWTGVKNKARKLGYLREGQD